MNNGSPAPVGTIERVYYAVPSHYTIGREFPDTIEGFSDAIAFAKSTIQRFDYGDAGEGFSRAFVDRRYVIRWAPDKAGLAHGVDEVVKRHEVKLTGIEKDALRGEKVAV